MLIRQDFKQEIDMPPRAYLEQIMGSVMKAYCLLWDIKDQENRVQMSWKDISKYYHKNTFKTSLRKLNEKGLLSYDESESGIEIELVGWDEFEEGL